MSAVSEHLWKIQGNMFACMFSSSKNGTTALRIIKISLTGPEGELQLQIEQADTNRPGGEMYQASLCTYWLLTLKLAFGNVKLSSSTFRAWGCLCVNFCLFAQWIPHNQMFVYCKRSTKMSTYSLSTTALLIASYWQCTVHTFAHFLTSWRVAT